MGTSYSPGNIYPYSWGISPRDPHRPGKVEARVQYCLTARSYRPAHAARTEWGSKGFDSPNPVPKSKRRLILCLGVLSLGISLEGGPITAANFSSNATIVNFDDLTGGSCNLCGPSVTNQYSGLGVTFNNPSFPGQDTADTNLVPFIPDASAPNALFVEQGGTLGEAPAVPFQILFSVPVTMAGFYYGSSSDAYLELDAYGANHQLLESVYFKGTSAPIGLEGFAGLEESSPIVELDVSYHPVSDPSRTLSFSIDNVEFQGSQVPEPSTFAPIAGGLAAMALWRRSRARSGKVT